jgi:hypothetical protein
MTDELTPPPPPKPRRPFGTWIKLLAVWAIGLVIWGIYVGLIVLVLVKLLS